ncbi:MAG: tyrosine-type recombinase/integrase [Proteobacteria bacterium]|jgi:integrase|nr:tyrosine-type recombinase/integrase [Pseudomonadota bacterium]
MTRKRRKGGRPKAISIEPLSARAVRPRGKTAEQDGLWYWQATVEKSGERRTVWSGWALRDEVVERLAEMRTKKEFCEPPQPITEVITVEDLMNVWVEKDVKGRADLSSYARRNYITAARHIIGVIGEVRVALVDDDTLCEYRDRRIRSQKAATSTVAAEIKKFRAAWSWAARRGFVPNRVVNSPKIVQVPVQEKYTPTSAEVGEVLHQLGEDTWPYLAVFLLFSTGARIDAISELRWGDVNFERGELRLQGKRTKTNPSGVRDVPIGAHVVDMLKKWGPGPSDVGIFGVSPKRIRAQLGPVFLKRACEQAGVRRFSPHALRRLVEDQLADAGVDVAVYAALLGHTPTIALQHYRRSTRSNAREAVVVARLGLLPKEQDNIVEFPGRRE